MPMLQTPARPPAPEPQKAALLTKPAQDQPPEQQEDGYDAAMTIVRESLYGAEAARDMAKAIKGAQDPATGLAEAAYQLVSIADEATEGTIPDERLVEFASETLSEVAEIADASGIEIKGAVIAKAMQMMLVRWVTEQGLDPTQLQAEMAKIDPEQLGAQLDKEGA